MHYCTCYDCKVKGDSTGEIDFTTDVLVRLNEELLSLDIILNGFQSELKQKWKFFINNYLPYIKRLISFPWISVRFCTCDR